MQKTMMYGHTAKKMFRRTMSAQLPPAQTLPDEESIVRYEELPDVFQENGYEPDCTEPTPEQSAELEARDLYLATLAPNEQGEIE